MRPLHAFVEAHAQLRPDRIAVSDGRLELSYARLNDRANSLSSRLLELGVGGGTPVGLSVTAGADVIIGMLGIMKAGGAYVSLDPELPARRLQRVAQKSGLAAIVADPVGAAAVDETAVPVLSVGTKAQRAANPDVAISPDQLCYVMFTSGSTGEPKGVEVSHGNLAALFDDIGPGIDIGADDTWTLFHTYGFGFSVWEIWGALRHGGRLVVVPPALRRDPPGFARLVADERVTVVSQTPSAFRQNFLDDSVSPAAFGPALRSIVLSGEAAVGADVRRWFARVDGSGSEIVQHVRDHRNERPVDVARIPRGCPRRRGSRVRRPTARARCFARARR